MTDARPRWRRIAARITTVLAGLLVLFVLIAPSDLERYTVEDFLRVPMEALLGVAIVAVLPPRIRRFVVPVAGAALGVLAMVKILDTGFDVVLYRPFDLVLDWPLFTPAIDYVAVTAGKPAAIAAVVAAVLLAIALVALTMLSVIRLSRSVARRRTPAVRVVALLAVVAFAVPGVPVASNTAVAFAYDHALQVRAGLQDQDLFAQEASVDAFRDTPADQMLTALRGKDVVITFVESYGRSAVEDSTISDVLDDGGAKLREAGYASKSGFLNSPTAGGGSWLAQATLLSGLWIDNQQRYRTLVASDRLTLPGAFKRANWRSIGVMPGITQAWPEGEFFGYDKIYAAQDLDYRGPRFSYATMPDQYTLSAFQREERSTAEGPVMAAIPLLSSHAPWSPIPFQIDWDQVGDGSIYNSMSSSGAPPESIFGRDPQLVRADYLKSVEYSVNNIVSYVQKYGDDDLVLVFLGDHQPAQMVTGENAGKDVPITIVARDQAVLERISDWGWNDGLKPAPEAPVWPMNEFRDRFLTAFGTPKP